MGIVPTKYDGNCVDFADCFLGVNVFLGASSRLRLEDCYNDHKGDWNFLDEKTQGGDDRSAEIVMTVDMDELLVHFTFAGLPVYMNNDDDGDEQHQGRRCAAMMSVARNGSIKPHAVRLMVDLMDHPPYVEIWASILSHDCRKNKVDKKN